MPDGLSQNFKRLVRLFKENAKKARAEAHSASSGIAAPSMA
jgi:hypothetical protein